MCKSIMIISSFCFLFSQCTSNVTISSSNVCTIDSIMDNEIYFKQGQHLTSINSDLLFVDAEKNKIIRLSHDLKLKNSWGTTGQAKNEFLMLLGIYCNENYLTVYDGVRKIMVDYDYNGDMLNQLSLKDGALQMQGHYRFIKQDSLIYGSAYSTDNSLITINHNNCSINTWGEIFTFPSQKQQSIRNDRHLFKHKENYFAISGSIPIIEKYDKAYKLISKFDLSSLERIANQLETINNKNLADNECCTLIADCYLYKDDLYLLFNNFIGRFASNEILQINIKNGFKPIHYIQLPLRTYSSFCVNDRGIYALRNMQSSIFLYEVI